MRAASSGVPTYASSTRGFFETSAYGPSARIAPRCEHRDRVRKIGDDVQVVLDHHDGAAGRDLAYQLDDASDVLVTHALRRLVEQHQFRIEREGRGDFQRTLAAVRQFDRHRIGERREVDRVEQLHRARIERVERARGLPEMKRSAELALQADAHVFEHRQMREHRRDLERADDAAARDLRRLFARDVDAVEVDAAARGLEKLREQVEARGLARAVGADQRMDAAALHFQAHVVDGDETLELLNEIARFEYVFVAHGQSVAGLVLFYRRGRFGLLAQYEFLNFARGSLRQHAEYDSFRHLEARHAGAAELDDLLVRSDSRPV